MKRPILRYGFFIIHCLLLSSCIATWLLKKDQVLYTGSMIKLHSDTAISDKGTLKSQLEDQLFPRPNKKFLFMPLKLWVYQIIGEPRRDGGIIHFLKYNYGEPPVLIQDVEKEDVLESLGGVLRTNGFLDSRVTARENVVWWDKKRRKVQYDFYLRPPYHLGKITNSIEDTAIIKLMKAQAKDSSILISGNRYKLDDLKKERERIDNILKANGYFYFSPEFILFLADSTVGRKRIDLEMLLVADIPPEYLQPWYVNRIYIKGNTLADTSFKDAGYPADGRETEHYVRPGALLKFIPIKEGKLLTYESYTKSVKNLSSINTFKFTNIDFSPDSVLKNYVNATISLIPFSSRSLRLQANLVSKSTSFAGPAVEVSHLNRNLLGGAELLTFTIDGSIEAWFGKETTETLGNFNYELGTSVEFNLPRLLFFRSSLFPASFVPRTNFELDFRFTNRTRYYRMSDTRFTFGYQWNEAENKFHELNPININYQHILSRTALFRALSDSNSLIRRSFEDQFIIGQTYTYQYNIPEAVQRSFKTAFIGNLDLSGNLIYLTQQLLGVNKPENQPYHFLGTTYSQYIKTTLDVRYYYSFSKNEKVAARTFIGVGIPLGNSGILPNIKQYFVGGTNSIRAFQIRSIGPGSYYLSPDSATFVDQTGDIRIEANIENRYLVGKSFEIALFLDMGNVWLARNDPSRPGSQFSFNSFYKQFAFGWGYGFRYINPYFIIRLDVGYPLRLPNAVQKNFLSGALFNLAIGYPF